jgi:hypothetical protein
MDGFIKPPLGTPLPGGEVKERLLLRIGRLSACPSMIARGSAA